MIAPKIYLLIYLAKLIHHNLSDDEYYILAHQKNLFSSYETVVNQLAHITIDQFSQSTGLHAAYAFQKCANVYRKINTPEYLNKAINYHQRALHLKKLFLKNVAIDIAESYVDLGATYNESKGIKNNEYAITYYQKALTIYESKGNEYLHCIASTLHKLANAHRDIDSCNKTRILQAINFINRALNIYATLPLDTEQLKDQARMFYNQGVNYHLLQDATQSLEFLGRAQKIFKSQNDTLRYAITISYMAKVYIDIHEKQQAIEQLLTALHIFSSIYPNDHHYIQEIYNLLQETQT